MEFFWCLDHHAVEQGEDVCRAEVRLGPYPSYGEAEQALQTLHERNDRLDAEDRVWDEGED
jgi:hypothetical protein